MHKFLITICMSVFLALGTQWKTVPAQLDALVDEVEQSAEDYSSEDWEKSNKKYSKLVDIYNNNREKYSKEERKVMNRAMARYQVLLVTNGFKETGSFLEMLKESFPSYADELKETVVDKGQELLEKARQIDMTKVGEAAEKLGDDITNLANELIEALENPDADSK